MGKGNVYCSGCREDFKVDKFEKGVSKCPHCGLKSLLREVKEKAPSSVPSELKKVEKPFFVCRNCNISWTDETTKTCLKCGRADVIIEYRET